MTTFLTTDGFTFSGEIEEYFTDDAGRHMVQVMAANGCLITAPTSALMVVA